MDLNLSYRDSLVTILFPTLDLSELDAWHQVQLVDNYFKEHFGHPYQFVEGDAFEDDLVHMLTNAYPVTFVQLLKHKDLMRHYSRGFKVLLLSIDEKKYEENFKSIITKYNEANTQRQVSELVQYLQRSASQN